MHTTVEEILVKDGRAAGVRLTDGTMLAADAVISTSSAPETILRLLGGRYCADETRERLARWKLFQPIVLASFGVSTPLAALPPMLIVDGIRPFEIGGRKNDHLYLRTYNDDATLAPEGHAVIQGLFESDYEWWATRGSNYERAKEEVTARALAQLEIAIPAVTNRVRMTDVATPLTYWSMARSWRGAYEGWMPNGDSLFGHVRKTLPGLEAFFMAGQWVEPGGGVPMAIMSGRQSAQLLCAAEGRPFVAGPESMNGE